jgi:hypothetical protein
VRYEAKKPKTLFDDLSDIKDSFEILEEINVETIDREFLNEKNQTVRCQEV